VDVVRRAWEAALRHDNETTLRLYDPEVEIEGHPLDHTATYRGLDRVREWARNALSAFSDLQSTVQEWIDAGDYVVAILRLTGRGRKSGVPVEKIEAHVWTVRDGKLRRLRIYESREKALKAVGLEE
jgi:ketosteroid isomerase-like protein